MEQILDISKKCYCKQHQEHAGVLNYSSLGTLVSCDYDGIMTALIILST